MSTFTDWGTPPPTASSIPVAKFTELISAYQSLVTRLNNHIESEIGQDKDTHGSRTVFTNITNSIQSLSNSLTGMIETKETVANVDRVRADITSLQSALNTLASNVAALSDNKAEASALSAEINRAENVEQDFETHLIQLRANWNSLLEYIELSDEDTLTFKKAVALTESIIGKIKVDKVLDFVKWRKVYAPFTSVTNIDNGVAALSGAYLLGCMSKEWLSSDGESLPAANDRSKACRVYVKYANSHSFDAVVDITATRASDGKYTGTIVAHCSKAEGAWEDMAFHTCHGTDSAGNESVYLAISSTDLVKAAGSYSNAEFYVAGENFIPAMPTVVSGTNNVDYDIAEAVKKAKVEGYFVPVGRLTGISSCYVGADTDVIAMSNVTADVLNASSYKDNHGAELFSVQVIGGKKFLVVGGDGVDDVKFKDRPYLVSQDGKYPFLTAADIKSIVGRVGEVVAWSKFKDGKPVNFPDNFLVCDGEEIDKKYTDLRAIVGDKTPLVDYHIIRAETGMELQSLFERGDGGTLADAVATLHDTAIYGRVEDLPMDVDTGAVAVLFVDGQYYVYKFNGSVWEVQK